VLLSGSAFALGSVATGVFAQSSPGWPTKPVRIVTGWSPGGNADILARMLADHIGKNSAFPVIVENRPGAAGALGAAVPP
jgi:tripartite-type tricarboxylate transporter receptor subunit TctC